MGINNQILLICAINLMNHARITKIMDYITKVDYTIMEQGNYYWLISSYKSETGKEYTSNPCEGTKH